MKLGWLWFFIMWYGMLSLAFGFIPESIRTGDVVNYDYVADMNSTGFGTGELAGATSIWDILGSIGRFFGFLFFGVFLPPETPEGFTVFLIFFNTSITLALIAFIISIFWEG